MRPFLTMLLMLAFPAAAQLPEVRSRPMSEMHGDCDNFAMNLTAELARWSGPSTTAKVSAEPSGGAGRPLLPGDLVKLELLSEGQFVTPIPPRQNRERAGTFGGTLRVSLPTAGRWRLLSDSGAWFDLVGRGGALPDPWFEMQTGCRKILKVVVFETTEPTEALLGISANTQPSLRLLVTPDRP